VRDFGDKPVCVKAPEEARDLTRLLFSLRCQRIRGPREVLSHISVGEAVQGVFAHQKYPEQEPLSARQRVECPDRPAVFGRCVGRQCIEISHGRGGILHLAQGIQVPDVALRRNLSISEQHRYTLS
jgi:hypothetical protein